MKRKKIFLAIAVFILIICVLAGFAGCTSGSSDNSAEQRDNAGEVKNSGENVIITTSDRLMVYYVDISVVVEDVAVAEAGITAKLKTFDGYTQTIRKSDSYTCLTLRVPTDKLEEFVAEIKGKGDVEGYTVTGVDITDEYMNAQNRKSALEAEKARLEALLAEASISSALLTPMIVPPFTPTVILLAPSPPSMVVLWTDR